MSCVRDERHHQEPFWLKFPEFYPIFLIKEQKLRQLNMILSQENTQLDSQNYHIWQ